MQIFGEIQSTLCTLAVPAQRWRNCREKGDFSGDEANEFVRPVKLVIK